MAARREGRSVRLGRREAVRSWRSRRSNGGASGVAERRRVGEVRPGSLERYLGADSPNPHRSDAPPRANRSSSSTILLPSPPEEISPTRKNPSCPRLHRSLPPPALRRTRRPPRGSRDGESSAEVSSLRAVSRSPAPRPRRRSERRGDDPGRAT
jgi:hypothetical protein